MRIVVALLVISMLIISCEPGELTEDTGSDDIVEEDTEPVDTCTDSDDGLDIANKGLLEGFNGSDYSFTDSCEGTFLTEYYCEDHHDIARTIDCVVEDFDDCDDGACVMSEIECGNDNVEGDEECDGNSRSCTTTDGYSGTQRCKSDCSGFGTCSADADCGDDDVNGAEECDGDDLDGETCESLDYVSGDLDCNLDCTFDTSECVAETDCGNGVIDGEEDCDDENDQGNVTLSGDYYMFEDLETGDDLDATLTVDDLELLEGDSLLGEDYTQELEFFDTTVQKDTNEDDEEDYFLFFDSNEIIFEYRLDFENDIETTVDNNLALEELEGENFYILGTKYSIDSAVVADPYEITLTLNSGTKEYVLFDDDFTDGDFSSGGSEYNGDELDEIEVYIEADHVDEDSDDAMSEGDAVEIANIYISVTAGSSDIFVPKHEGLRENIEKPETLLSLDWDIWYEYLVNSEDDFVYVYILGDADVDDDRDGCSIVCTVDPGWTCDDDEPTDCSED